MSDPITEYRRVTNRELNDLRAENERLKAERDALLMQAQIQAQEMRTQRATVREIYQLCTGESGEPGDWHGAEPVRKLMAERDALRGRVHEALGFAFAFACQRLDDGHDPRNIKVPLLLEAWNSALAAGEER